MRVVNLFNDNWYFTKSPDLPEKLGEGFEKVTLPHTWNL